MSVSMAAARANALVPSSLPACRNPRGHQQQHTIKLEAAEPLPRRLEPPQEPNPKLHPPCARPARPGAVRPPPRPHQFRAPSAPWGQAKSEITQMRTARRWRQCCRCSGQCRRWQSREQYDAASAGAGAAAGPSSPYADGIWTRTGKQWDEIRPSWGQLRPNLAALARFGHFWADADRCSAELGRTRPNVWQVWPGLGRIWQKWMSTRPEFERLHAVVWPNSSKPRHMHMRKLTRLRHNQPAERHDLVWNVY